MALWRCKRCTTVFAVGLHCCPQCTGTDVEEDSEMPKITVHGGATNAAEAGRPPTPASVGSEITGEVVEFEGQPPSGPLPEVPESAYGPDSVPLEATPLATGGVVTDGFQLSDESGPEQIRTERELPAAEGSEQPSPGNSSETSPEKPPTNDAPNGPAHPKRARTTGNRSGKGPKASSTARSTGGSGLETDG